MSTAMSSTPDDLTLRSSLRGAALAGGIGAALLVGVLGLWAVTTVISGAVIASGQAVVHGAPQQVQHLDGGIVAEIAVRNGDIVEAGDVLVGLDPTLLQMNLDIAKRRLVDALTLRARLEAEQAGRDTLVFTYPDLPFDLPDATGAEAGQSQIFAARAAVQQGSRDQLAEIQMQFDNQITGQRAQMAAIGEQIVLLDADIANIRDLADRNLARQSQLSDLQRGKSELAGRLAALEAEIGRLTNAKRDSETQTLQQERAFHEAVVTELRAASSQSEELILDIVTRTAQLDRIDIRAPRSGIVHELQVSTLGGVIQPGQVIVQIIPQDQGLDFEMRVNPSDIDQVYVGQASEAIIASLDQNNTPKLAATVAGISPNAIVDPQTGERYYRIDLSIPATEIARLGDVEIVPGMPVEAFLVTQNRSVMDYLMSPVTKQLRYAFRDS